MKAKEKMGMQARKVTLKDVESSYCCMSETPESVSWADFLPESRKWFKENLGRHVEGYHILDDGRVVGHIYYASSENALVPFEVEPKVAFIYCTEMLHNFLHKGYGRIMFDYMKSDLKKNGFKGILVDATDFQEFMHYSLFLKQGFKVVMEHKPYRLMYFPLLKDKVGFKMFELNYKPLKDKVEVTLFKNFFCPVGVQMYYLIKKVAESFGDKVKIVEINPTVTNIRKFGTSDPLVNGKTKFLGPASEQNVRKAIQEEIDQFKR